MVPSGVLIVQTEPQIEFRHMAPSEALSSDISRRIAHLEHLFDRVVGCRVVVEAPHRHHRQGKLYRVSVEIDVPGRRLVANHARPHDHAHEDAHVAVRDAFDAAARQLQDHAREWRGDVKSHTEPPHGRVVKLFAGQGYGFIELSDGQDVYFHRNSVEGDGFDRLAVGDRVHVTVIEGESDKGAQASIVRPVARHGT